MMTIKRRYIVPRLKVLQAYIPNGQPKQGFFLLRMAWLSQQQQADTALVQYN